jgi:hypothetical protein
VTSHFPCPWLGGEVELTEERERHIREGHPDLLPEHRDKLAEVLRDPDTIRRSVRAATAHVFSRWYTSLRQGRHVAVIVVSDAALPVRHWIITAYMTRRLAPGEIEWERS